MSRFSEQQVERQEKTAKERFVKELTSKTIHNMGVVTYTGMVVGGFASILQQGHITFWHIFIAALGMTITFLLIYIGNKIGRK